MNWKSIFKKDIREFVVGENKNPFKKKTPKKKYSGILTLREKEHRFYEIRWYRGKKLVLMSIESFYFYRRKIFKKFMFKI